MQFLEKIRNKGKSAFESACGFFSHAGHEMAVAETQRALDLAKQGYMQVPRSIGQLDRMSAGMLMAVPCDSEDAARALVSQLEHNLKELTAPRADRDLG